MASDLRTGLRGLPPLDSGNRDRDARPCRVCGTAASFFDSVDFNKVCSETDPFMFGPAGTSIAYFQCPNCDFLFADDMMTWSTDDLAELIYNQDYIKVDGEYADARPTRMAQSMATLLAGCEGARILDYGSGSGRLAEVMATDGFDVASYDPFSSPARPDGRFDIILCFEVIEHSRDPAATLADIASLMATGGCLIFSQTLQPPDLDRLRGAWWYLAPRNGHISLFSPVTFAWLAAAEGMTFSRFVHHGYLYAMTLGERSVFTQRALADTRPFQAVRLAAPVNDEPNWNDLERPPEGPLRWTAGDVVEWPVAPITDLAFDARIMLRFVAEIVPGFAAGSTFAWGDASAAATVRGRRLQVDLAVNAPSPSIALRTPPPLRPDDLNGCGDLRRLGLYVPVVPVDDGR